MSNRHLARTIAVQTLYQWDFNNQEGDIMAMLEHNRQEFAPEFDDHQFITHLVDGVLTHQKEIAIGARVALVGILLVTAGGAILAGCGGGGGGTATATATLSENALKATNAAIGARDLGGQFLATQCAAGGCGSIPYVYTPIPTLTP